MLSPQAEKLQHKRVVLASQSPRRLELLQTCMRIQPIVRTARVNETLQKDEYASAASYCIATAQLKALDVARRSQDADIVIAGDTVVHASHQSVSSVLEKPESKEHAMHMLQSLSNSAHSVTSAVCLVLPQSEPQHEQLVRSFANTTDVFMDKLDQEVIEAYVDSGEAYGKAGAYGIQGAASTLVRGLSGDYFTVMGLPLNLLSHHLRELFAQGSL